MHSRKNSVSFFLYPSARIPGSSRQPVFSFLQTPIQVELCNFPLPFLLISGYAPGLAFSPPQPVPVWQRKLPLQVRSGFLQRTSHTGMSDVPALLLPSLASSSAPLPFFASLSCGSPHLKALRKNRLFLFCYRFL